MFRTVLKLIAIIAVVLSAGILGLMYYLYKQLEDLEAQPIGHPEEPEPVTIEIEDSSDI